MEETVDRFVHLWSDMAAAWGINRTMAQIHALLYAESRPLNTDDVMDRLGISRGSASMNLRELLQWELIRKVAVEGDRKEYFAAETDVWTIVSKIVQHRQQREISPVLEHLRGMVQALPDSASLEAGDRPDGSDSATKGQGSPSEARLAVEFRERMQVFIDFLEMFERFTNALLPYISKENLSVIKQLVRIAEAGRTFKEWRTGSAKGDVPPKRPPADPAEASNSKSEDP